MPRLHLGATEVKWGPYNDRHGQQRPFHYFIRSRDMLCARVKVFLLAMWFRSMEASSSSVLSPPLLPLLSSAPTLKPPERKVHMRSTEYSKDCSSGGTPLELLIFLPLSASKYWIIFMSNSSSHLAVSKLWCKSPGAGLSDLSCDSPLLGSGSAPWWQAAVVGGRPSLWRRLRRPGL